jgi:hypothetical protein
MTITAPVVPSEQISTCPCCGQRVWLRKHPITWTMAVGMCCIYIYFKRSDASVYVHTRELAVKVPAFAKVVHSGGEFAQLAHWNFIEQMPGEKPDGNPHNGFWRITDLGRKFVEGDVAFRFVYTFNRTCYGFSDGVTLAPDGNPFPLAVVTLADAFDTPFSYDSLLTGDWSPPAKSRRKIRE